MKRALQHLRKDPILAEIIDRVGTYGIQFREPNFETLVKSIVYQQLSGRVAGVIFASVAAAVAESPMTPEAVLRLTPRKMRALGLSKQKVEYIRDLAKRTLAGQIDFASCHGFSDDELIERFTAVKGIGAWTVQMFLSLIHI